MLGNLIAAALMVGWCVFFYVVMGKQVTVYMDRRKEKPEKDPLEW